MSEIEEIIMLIEGLEDDLDRLIETSELSYDQKFHQDIVEKVNDIRAEIQKLGVDESEKALIMSLINELVKLAKDELSLNLQLNNF